METIKFFKGIILMVIFSMILIQVSAQDKNEGNRNQNNPHEQTAAPVPPAPPSAPAPPPPPQALEPIDNAAALLNIPGLSEDQKAEIDKLHLKQLEAMTPLKNRIREKSARLETLLTTMPFDLNAADVVSDDLGKIHTEILKLMIRHDQALRNLLTPDQQVIFDSLPKSFLRKLR